jgi:hypothetical protein
MGHAGMSADRHWSAAKTFCGDQQAAEKIERGRVDLMVGKMHA